MNNIKESILLIAPLLKSVGLRGDKAFSFTKNIFEGKFVYTLELKLSDSGRVWFKTSSTTCIFNEDVKTFFIEHNLKENDFNNLVEHINPILRNLKFNETTVISPIFGLYVRRDGIINLHTNEFIYRGSQFGLIPEGFI